ncbi:MAG: glycosyl transferase, partial [Gammaproteobacteria bacterium]|nr:glycosyl transferase [Gammaproteobacteria bacterium]
DSVFLLGHKNPAIDYISSADLVVIPSRNEGFSYVFAEALLERTPVISTNVPIPNEVLPKEYLCAIDSVEAIGQLLETTLSDMSGLEHSFSPLFDYAKKNLTLSRSRDKTLAAYSALIE